MQEGLGALTAVVTDGGNVESGSKTIPVVLQTVDVKFYPEGGVLVPGKTLLLGVSLERFVFVSQRRLDGIQCGSCLDSGMPTVG
jgi:hypothetical protein